MGAGKCAGYKRPLDGTEWQDELGELWKRVSLALESRDTEKARTCREAPLRCAKVSEDIWCSGRRWWDACVT